jgi:hypothetical protein
MNIQTLDIEFLESPAIKISPLKASGDKLRDARKSFWARQWERLRPT